MQTDKTQKHSPGRIIGFDCHPDSFTAAVLRGSTPATSVVEQTFDKVPMARLQNWARKHTTENDLLVLEASGNTFEVVRQLHQLNRRAEVFESCHLGKLKEAHANNDRLSAVRIAKAYLSGTAKKVWLPDSKTQQRRDWFHAHQKAVRRTTQMRNRLLSYLSDNGVRQSKAKLAKETLRAIKTWSPQQWQVIEILLEDLQHAEQQRTKWRSLLAQEVANDPLLLSLMRLCGVRVVVAFGIAAVVGDIQRFASPKALVKYLGLNPAFDDSGNNQWRGGVGKHGRSDLRSLLIESAQSILRSQHPMAKWGRRLLARKGSLKLVVAAVARKLAVAIWYLMMGRWTALTDIDLALRGKINKLISTVGAAGLQAQSLTRQQMRAQVSVSLQRGRTYLLFDAAT